MLQMGASNSIPLLLRLHFSNTYRVLLRTSKLNDCGLCRWSAPSWWALMNAMELLEDPLAPCGVETQMGFF